VSPAVDWHIAVATKVSEAVLKVIAFAYREGVIMFWKVVLAIGEKNE
jgi:hypothetical protein